MYFIGDYYPASGAIVVYLQNRQEIPKYAVPNAKLAVELASRLHQVAS